MASEHIPTPATAPRNESGDGGREAWAQTRPPRQESGARGDRGAGLGGDERGALSERSRNSWAIAMSKRL